MKLLELTECPTPEKLWQLVNENEEIVENAGAENVIKVQVLVWAGLLFTTKFTEAINVLKECIATKQDICRTIIYATEEQFKLSFGTSLNVYSTSRQLSKDIPEDLTLPYTWLLGTLISGNSETVNIVNYMNRAPHKIPNLDSMIDECLVVVNNKKLFPYTFNNPLTANLMNPSMFEMLLNKNKEAFRQYFPSAAKKKPVILEDIEDLPAYLLKLIITNPKGYKLPKIVIKGNE